MAPCSASGFLGCAVPLPCFPELTVSPPHTCSHQRAGMPSAALQSVGSRGESSVHPFHPLGPSGVHSSVLREQESLRRLPVPQSALKEADEGEQPQFYGFGHLEFKTELECPQKTAPVVLWAALQPVQGCEMPPLQLLAGWKLEEISLKTVFSLFPSFAIHLIGLSNWRNGNGRGSAVFYWSEQAELQIPWAAGGREGKTSSRSCNRSSVAKESPVQGRREKSPKHTQIFTVPLSAQNFCAQPLQTKGIGAEI